MNTRAFLLFSFVLAALPAQASDLEFAAKANALCRAIIDERDYPTFKAAQDRTVDLTIAQLRTGTPPSTEAAQTLSHLLQSVNADLVAAIERLQALPSSPKLETFLDYGRSRVEINAARVNLLADLDGWRWPPADSLHTNQYDYSTGMADLGFTDRDCSYVFESLGNPPELSDFISTVAAICNTTYDRLARTDIDQWREHNLNAMVAALKDEAQDPAAIPALRSLAKVWKEAAQAFQQVDRNIEQSRFWDETIANLYKRSEVFTERADALEHRDKDAIRSAFGNRLGTPDFEQLGLRETSCIALASLM